MLHVFSLVAVLIYASSRYAMNEGTRSLDGEQTLRLLACTTSPSYSATTTLQNRIQPNSPRTLHLSPDGTTLVTHSEDLTLCSFVLSTDLLTSPTTLDLKPYSALCDLQSHAQALPPYFSLSDPSTTHILLSRTDLPLRLSNALDLSYTHATYPLIHAPTEAFIAPHSLAFSSDGTKFIAGSKGLISIFDVTRDGEGPIGSLATGRSRGRQTPGSGLSGYIMSLEPCTPTGILAAGSTGGEVALYDLGRSREEVLSFALTGEDGRTGKGVSQVKWADDGRYLAVAQRQSNGISVWDVRMGRRLVFLGGREAGLPMRMGFDVVRNDGSMEIWAGGVDGRVRVWQNFLSDSGTVEPSQGYKISSDAVTNARVHPCGEVMFTSEGSRKDSLDGLSATATPLVNVGIKAWAI